MSGTLSERLTAMAQAAGVLATAWFVWVTTILPRLGLQSLASIAAEATLYVILAWIAGAFITFWIYIVVSLGDFPQATRFSLRDSAPAMWFAPSIVLLSTRIPAAFFISLFLVANSTRQLIAQWGGFESPVPEAEPAALRPPLLLGRAGPDTTFLTLHSLPVLLTSATAQAGMVALLWRHPLLAAALLSLATAVLTSISISTGAYLPGKAAALPHSALSIVMTFLLAAAVTVGGISARGRSLFGPESATGDSDSGGAAKAPLDPGAPPDESAGLGGDFPGVVLLPEIAPHSTLLVPLRSTSAAAGVPLLTPLGIPFTGTYWMYRWPARRPPRSSIVRRGNPLNFSFHTTDGMSMEMEARQRLDNPIDAHCCSAVQLAIRNADDFTDSIALELKLADSHTPNQIAILGTELVGPSRSSQTLTFRFPAATALKVFDEFQIVFRRARWRADKSARVSVDRVVLVP